MPDTIMRNDSKNYLPGKMSQNYFLLCDIMLQNSNLDKMVWKQIFLNTVGKTYTVSEN